MVRDQETLETFAVFGSFPGWDRNCKPLATITVGTAYLVCYGLGRTKVLPSTYYFTVNDFFENDWIKRSEQYQLDQFNENVFGEGANKSVYVKIGMDVEYSNRFPSNDYPSERFPKHVLFTVRF